MTNYVVAIPSYKRHVEITSKSLPTLKKGKVPAKNIYVFVANKTEEKIYKEKLDPSTYNKIVVGKKGIVQQRKFISQYFPECQYVVSMDDDVESVQKLTGDKLKPVTNLDKFFKDAYKVLKKNGLYLWGIYPVNNPFFMYNKTTNDLRFIIGVLFGYINRHDKILYPSLKSATKEDYHQTVLYFMEDHGVIRFNNFTVKTKFDAPGGLGDKGRFERAEKAASFLHKKYPKIVTRKRRKSGKAEINLDRYAKSKKKQKTKRKKCY